MEHVIDKLAWIEIQDRRVLYVRSKGKDLFYSPGGKREGEESDEQSLTREIREELDVALKPDTFTYLNTFSAQAHGKPEGTMVEIKCYTAEYDGELKPSAEIEELAWFTSGDVERTSVTGKLILAWLKDKNLID